MFFSFGSLLHQCSGCVIKLSIEAGFWAKSTLRGKVDLTLGKVDFQLKDDFAPRTKDKDASLVFRPMAITIYSGGPIRLPLKVDFQLKDDFAPRTKDKDTSLVFRPKTKMRLWSWGKVVSSSGKFD